MENKFQNGGRTLINKLMNYMDWKEKRRFLLSIFISVLTILSGAALFGLSAFLIAFCGMRPPISDIMVAVVGVRFFGILRALLRYMERLVTHEATFRLIGKIRTGLLQGLNERTDEELDQLDKKDTLVKLVDDTERLQDFYLRTFQPMATGLLCGIIGFVLFLKLVNLNTALVFGITYFGAILIWPILSMLTTKKQIEVLMKEQALSKELLLEYFSNYMDISCNSAEGRWEKRLNEKWTNIEKSENRIALISSLTNGLNIIFINSAMAAILYMSWRLLQGGGMLNLLIPVFALIIPALFEGTAALTSFYEKFMKSDLSAKRVFSLMKLKEAGENPLSMVTEMEQGENDLEDKDLISLKNISFCSGGRSVLANIDLKLTKGKKIGIVGPSGSGKTTLGKIIIGGIQPTAGEIQSFKNREELFSVVNQSVFLFNTTLKNNLLIGNLNATEAEIKDALQTVDMWSFCSELPDGINTEIGENGMRLSGGQRQRIAIARALLNEKNYLVLDEGTSGLDISTEKSILEKIFEKYKDKGIIVITHRLTKMEAYDEIIVIKNGRIEERGTHKDLENRAGWYSKVQNIIKNHLN